MQKQIIQIQELDGGFLMDKLEFIETRIENLYQNHQPKEPTQYQTTKEVAAMFGVSTVTISNWTKSNILKSYKIGNRVYYKRHEVETALTEIKTPSTNG